MQHVFDGQATDIIKFTPALVNLLALFKQHFTKF